MVVLSKGRAYTAPKIAYSIALSIAQAIAQLAKTRVSIEHTNQGEVGLRLLGRHAVSPGVSVGRYES